MSETNGTARKRDQASLIITDDLFAPLDTSPITLSTVCNLLFYGVTQGFLEVSSNHNFNPLTEFVSIE